MDGLFITLEGGEGSGKTTVAKYLVERLTKEGYDVLLTREPGGVKIAEQIRAVILDTNNTDMDPRTEAILYAASRRQHLVEKVIPALKEGKIVICDRYIDSSFAYQGFARGIGMSAIKDLNNFAITDGGKIYYPDLSLYFDVDPEIGLQRVSQRGDELTRLDKEKLEFHDKVRKGYLTVYSLNEYMKMIDASKSLEEVEQEAYDRVRAAINKREELLSYDKN
ncbi:MAG: dTMP kinase [Methanobrevibacter sp.]|nr:dTMP kinase [Methanobrevibacter sp.]